MQNDMTRPSILSIYTNEPRHEKTFRRYFAMPRCDKWLAF